MQTDQVVHFTDENIQELVKRIEDSSATSVKIDKAWLQAFAAGATKFRESAVQKGIDLIDREEELEGISKQLEAADIKIESLTHDLEQAQVKIEDLGYMLDTVNAHFDGVGFFTAYSAVKAVQNYLTTNRDSYIPTPAIDVVESNS